MTCAQLPEGQPPVLWHNDEEQSGVRPPVVIEHDSFNMPICMKETFKIVIIIP